RLALGGVGVSKDEREALHERGDLVEHAEDLPRDLAVALHARRDADRSGAEAQRGMHGHGRAHTELTDRVAGRGDHSAAAGPPDDHRFADELRVVTLFDRCIERVHVDVQDGASHSVRTLYAIVTSARKEPSTTYAPASAPSFAAVRSHPCP